ncbi:MULTISPECIES: YafY family protein [unclassified Curtobacterium]|uniref:helix-turn-helix transcriptional regulator n=1 Tax=unclassified Curtobacterium TaxID=257496 RepID=UPI0008DC9B85|nr:MULTISPECIES: WYL domain-containing protein [unclassified Curtobacterium]OIH98644.1 WYL domain-containing protein [Curtobacterium sp. MCBA15_003]OII32368.1 WYL domain-containing protein [Curtobacterium sp. MMLR14_006]
MPATRVPRVPAEERLFSLVLALLSTESGLTKGEILANVQGYRQRFTAGGDNASLERQFERDKDDVRELGIPLETIETPGAAGNNQTLRYRIPKGEYDLPVDVRFTPDESALLSLAAMAWREGALSADSRRGLLKVRSAGAEDDDGALQLGVDAYAPRLRARDAAFEPLRSALDRAAAVRFDYITPGQHAARRRDVAPLALVQHGGRWMLAAHEFATDSDKNYLLSRIVGPVSQYAVGQHTAPAGAAERTLAGLERIWATRTARIAVIPGSDAERRLTRRRDTETDADGSLVLHHVDPQILAEELAAFGPEVRVLEPDDLRARVLDRLRALVDDHATPDAGEEPARG